MAQIRTPSRADPPGLSQAGRQTRLYPPIQGAEPQTTPDYQDFFAKRFELAYSITKHHISLASRRAIAALLLVLANLLLLGACLWLGAELSPTGGVFFWFLRLVALLLLIGTWCCSLVSSGFTLASAVWKNHPGSQEGDLFFQSGGGNLPEEAVFAQQFKEASHTEMLDGALHALYEHARFRQRQEQWLRFAILFFAIALLGLSVSALLAIFL